MDTFLRSALSGRQHTNLLGTFPRTFSITLVHLRSNYRGTQRHTAVMWDQHNWLLELYRCSNLEILHTALCDCPHRILMDKLPSIFFRSQSTKGLLGTRPRKPRLNYQQTIHQDTLTHSI